MFKILLKRKQSAIKEVFFDAFLKSLKEQTRSPDGINEKGIYTLSGSFDEDITVSKTELSFEIIEFKFSIEAIIWSPEVITFRTFENVWDTLRLGELYKQHRYPETKKHIKELDIKFSGGEYSMKGFSMQGNMQKPSADKPDKQIIEQYCKRLIDYVDSIEDEYA